MDVGQNQTELEFVCDMVVGKFYSVEVFQLQRNKLSGNNEPNEAFNLTVQVLVDNMLKVSQIRRLCISFQLFLWFLLVSLIFFKVEIPVIDAKSHYDEKFYVWTSDEYIRPAPVILKNLLFDIYTTDGIYFNKPVIGWKIWKCQTRVKI